MPRRLNPYSKSRNKKLSVEEKKGNLRTFVNQNLIVPCLNQNSNRRTACDCLDVFLSNDDLVDQLLLLLERFEGLNQKERQLFLHGVITHGFIAKQNLHRGCLKEPIFLLSGIENETVESVNVCHNGIQNLFCIGTKQWKRLCSDAMLPDGKNLSNYENNKNAKSTEVTKSVIDFISDIAEQEGESHATRFVRTEVQLFLRDEDLQLIQLPPYYTKRQLYERYCYERGWIGKSNAKGTYPPIQEFRNRPNDDENGDLALWPSGSLQQDICSWRQFHRLWMETLPHIKIRPPALDTCVACNIFRNISKYRISSNEVPHTLTGSLVCPETNEPSYLEIPIDEQEVARENLVLGAAKHVKAARSQKALAQNKIEKAKSENELLSTDRNVTTLIVDYCQNLDLPHLGGEQPGDTYYLSPIWLYCLGIVNAAEGKLYAYMYQENSAKKGMNNVASLLMHYIKNYLLNEHQRTNHNFQKEELNIIMDNCGGQNKNNVVIRLGAYLCEVGYFKKVNFVFLVKGHTKNSADRMFNLLKHRWHKMQVYTYQQALESLAVNDDVTVIDSSNLHYDYAKFLNTIYKQPVTGTIKKNHRFMFRSDTMENVTMQTKQSDNVLVTSSQPLKKTKGIIPSIRKLMLLFPILTPLPKPGFKPIKQVHLYTKWRKFVPYHLKDITCPLPPNSIVSKVQKPKRKLNEDDNDSDIEIIFKRNTLKKTNSTELKQSGEDNESIVSIINTKQRKRLINQRKPKRKKQKLITRTAVINGVERSTEDIPSDVTHLDSDLYSFESDIDNVGMSIASLKENAIDGERQDVKDDNVVSFNNESEPDSIMCQDLYWTNIQNSTIDESSKVIGLEFASNEIYDAMVDNDECQIKTMNEPFY